MSTHQQHLKNRGIIPRGPTKGARTAGFSMRLVGAQSTGPWLYEDYLPGAEHPIYVGVTCSWNRLITRPRNMHHTRLAKAAGNIERRVPLQGYDHATLLRAEKARIAALRAAGAQLTNRTAGGDGGPGHCGASRPVKHKRPSPRQSLAAFLAEVI